MADFDSALSHPTFPTGQPFTVVTNVVYQELLAKLPLDLEGSSKQLVKELRKKHWFEWLRKDETLWTIPISKKQIEKESGYTLVIAASFLSLRPNLVLHRDGLSNIHEGRCIIAMISKNSSEILGYSNGDYHNEWSGLGGEDYDEKVSFGGFPIRFG